MQIVVHITISKVQRHSMRYRQREPGAEETAETDIVTEVSAEDKFNGLRHSRREFLRFKPRSLTLCKQGCRFVDRAMDAGKSGVFLLLFDERNNAVRETVDGGIGRLHRMSEMGTFYPTDFAGFEVIDHKLLEGRQRQN